ncbi:MAG: response regulator [bacterium]|nr:response regulator [bacterium]
MPHLLVVDDDDMVRSIVERILVAKGHTVSAVAGGAEALALLMQQTPEMILSDIDMPEMDGHELFREVRLRGFGMPFVAMSGHRFAPEKTAEFDGFIGKPFQLPHLIETVEHALVGQAVA